MENTLARRFVAELLGTFLLLLVAGHAWLTKSLLFLPSNTTGKYVTRDIFTPEGIGNAVAVGVILAVLVVLFGGISGGHFNPMVSLAALLFRTLNPAEFAAYVSAQIAGGILGAITATYFDGGLPNGLHVGTASPTHKYWLYISEFVATIILVTVVHSVVRSGRANLVPVALGGWAMVMVAALPQAYANSAVAIGDFFTGKSAPNFGAVALYVGIEIVGAIGAWVLVSFLFPEDKSAPAPAPSYSTF